MNLSIAKRVRKLRRKVREIRRAIKKIIHDCEYNWYDQILLEVIEQSKSLEDSIRCSWLYFTPTPVILNAKLLKSRKQRRLEEKKWKPAGLNKIKRRVFVKICKTNLKKVRDIFTGI